MHTRVTGRTVRSTVAGEGYEAFVPFPLPPDPPLVLDMEHMNLMEQANRALGRLDGISTLLPEPTLFLYFYVRKEAVLSSQIEGTQSSLSDLLMFEMEETPGVPLHDVIEVSNYVAAMDHGMKRLEELPISMRLIKEMHAILLSRGRGTNKMPGEVRRSQNWIGGQHPGKARFVPPPWEEVETCLSDLEKFLNDIPRKTPALVKAAMAHVQFETIHPFLDGNGRLGRLLITLLLCAEKALSQPMLYLSLYFKTHRQEYYDRLQRVRKEGDWEGWLKFFLTGVRETADQSVSTARRILQLFSDDRKKIERLGRVAASVLRVHLVLQVHPISSAPALGKKLNLTGPTVTSALKQLVQLGIVRELTGKERHRLFGYQPYLDLLNEATEPL
jgi:Fic family protein